MLDGLVLPRLAPQFQKFGHICVQSGIHPNHITWIGFALGLAGCFTVAMGTYGAGLLFLLLNRFLDGVDGATARAGEGATGYGAYLDTTLDHIIYAGFLFAFALSAPENLMAAGFALFAYSGVAVASLAAGQASVGFTNIADEERSTAFPPKRLVGETEMTLLIVITCLMPTLFSGFAALWGIMCIASLGLHIFLAARRS